MEKKIDVLSSKKIRITPQRLAVYSALLDKRHATAEEIFKKVIKQFPSISFATVYSILQLFKEKSLLQEVRIDSERSTFDIRIDGHHHFKCKKCGRIYDIDIEPCSTLKRGKINGHKIENFQGYFYGICKKCRKEK